VNGLTFLLKSLFNSGLLICFSCFVIVYHLIPAVLLIYLLSLADKVLADNTITTFVVFGGSIYVMATYFPIPKRVYEYFGKVSKETFRDL
jgi:ethanolamine transporter EutH